MGAECTSYNPEMRFASTFKRSTPTTVASSASSAFPLHFFWIGALLYAETRIGS
jgi:hypothetical protein